MEGQNKWGSEFEKQLKTIIKRQKEQQQDVIKHKTKIYTEVCYFTLKIGRRNTNKEGNKMRSLYKSQFL